MRRVVVLAITLLVGSMFWAESLTAGPVISPVQLRYIGINQVSGPFGSVRQGATLTYELDLANIRRTSLGKLRVDVFLPGQTINYKSLRLELSRGAALATKLVVGDHIRFIVTKLPSLGAGYITVTTKVVGGSNGKFCNKFLLTYGNKTADYSPPCVLVRPGV